MLRLDANRPARFCDGLTRRDFVHVGALAPLGLTLAGYQAAQAQGTAQDRDVNCIMLFLVGGPSHIDTFDPKLMSDNYNARPTTTRIPDLI